MIFTYMRAAINKVDIERSPNLVTVTISTAKAGVVIGRGGAGAQELKAAVEKIYGVPARINIEEIKKPELFAKLVAENIDKTLMHPHLKLFTALFVDVRAFYDRKGTAACRQWNRTGQAGAGAQCGVDDLLGSLVNDFVVIGLKADANAQSFLLLYHEKTPMCYTVTLNWFCLMRSQTSSRYD